MRKKRRKKGPTPRRKKHDPHAETKIRCDGCGWVGFSPRGGEFASGCPTCGCVTGTYA